MRLQYDEMIVLSGIGLGLMAIPISFFFPRLGRRIGSAAVLIGMLMGIFIVVAFVLDPRVATSRRLPLSLLIVGLLPIVLGAGGMMLADYRIERRQFDPRRAGHCHNCGYHLRGLIEPRCPECGAAFPKEWLAIKHRKTERSGADDPQA